jgi:cytochrome c oxidase subunit II
VRRVVRSGAVAAVTSIVLLVAGCTEKTPSVFRPDSTQSHDITTLAYTLFAILAFVLLVVWAWLFLAIVRYRRRPESAVRQTHGNTMVEIVWTTIPVVIVAVLFVLTVRTTAAVDASTTGVYFKATAHQWWWEVTYPAGHFETANEIHVPVDTPVRADMLSADVIHSYWVPQMGGKIDMIPGHPNRYHFLPLTEGTYIGECSEFCGHQHANMRFLLVVQSAKGFAAWFANQVKPARNPTTGLERAGAQTIATQPCAGCHTIRGNDMLGTVGPDLTHFGSRRGIAALTLPNAAQDLRRWLTDPQGVKPHNKMPKVPLTARQLDEIVAYLESLK